MLETKTLFTKLQELEERKRALYNEEKQIKAEIAEVENRILDDMAESGVSMMEFNGQRYSPTVKVQPSSDDWDATFSWIKENNAFYLVQKRLSAPAVKELLDDGEQIPGLKIYEETKLTRRKVRS